MTWWLPKRFRPPGLKKNGEKESAKRVQESSDKLNKAIKDSNEVQRVSAKSKELAAGDEFSKALNRAMRRAQHG